MRLLFFFFFNDTATTEIYTLSLHDALPISCNDPEIKALCLPFRIARLRGASLIQRKRELSGHNDSIAERSEEHTSELQSPCNLVCRLLLEKKKKKNRTIQGL